MIRHENEEGVESKGAGGNKCEASHHGEAIISPKRRDGLLDHLPALLQSKESARLAHSAADKPGDLGQRQGQEES